MINLSKLVLGVDDLSLLNRGLSFVPSKSIMKYETYKNRIKYINRRILLHDFFYTEKYL